MSTDVAATLTGLLVGIGLAAACGFRIFVPLLVAALAAKAGHIQFAPGWQWVASYPAIIALSAATALEVAAYYIPWLDNLLDSIATPAAIVAGTLITASAISGMSPLLRWSLAIIAGGGAAGLVQATTILVRAASTATTAGVGNPAVSTAEAGLSVGLSLLAVFLPILAVGMVVVLLFAVLRFFLRKLFRRSKADAA